MATTRDYVDYLNDQIGIAPANSQEELQAAQLIQQIMDEHQLETRLQEFDAPGSGDLPYRILMVVLFVGVLLAGIQGTPAAIVGIVLVVICMLLFLLRFMGNDLLSNLGPRARSQNVVGVHRAEGPLVTKGSRPIVIVAHYDTPRENFLYKAPMARFQPLLRRYAPICVAIACVLGLLQGVGFLPAIARRLFWVVALVASLPLVILGAASIAERFSGYTDGANDNKAAVAAMLGVLGKVRPGDDSATGYEAAHPIRQVQPVEEEAEEEVPEEEPEPEPEPIPQLVTDRYETVVGVRHGKETLAALRMLPNSCEIVYAEPRLVSRVIRPEGVDEGDYADLEGMPADQLGPLARLRHAARADYDRAEAEEGPSLSERGHELASKVGGFFSGLRDRLPKRKAAEEAKRKPYVTLADIPEAPPEEENPRALFRRGYLRKGGGLIVASVAGAGKSTFSLQCALHWVIGESCFGIDPVRPLRVAVIQAEDDTEELAMFRASMKQGLTADGFTNERIEQALRLLHIRTDFIGKTGADFADALRAMQTRDKYELVIVNPLNSYFDGDISLNKDATEFFRTMIDPVIKNPDTECGIMFIHHMGKPAKGKDAANWGKGAYAQYAMQGAAELNNWARAVLIIVPFDNAPDFWTITAAKRYKPLAWKDADGNDTKDKVIAYSNGYSYWREPSAEEIRAAKDGTKPTHETKEERERREIEEYNQAISEIKAYLQRVKIPLKKTELYSWCSKNASAVFKGFRSHTVKKPDGTPYPPNPCFRAYEIITERPLENGVAYHVVKSRNGREYGVYGGVVDGLPVGTGAAQADAISAQAADTEQADAISAQADAPNEYKTFDEIFDGCADEYGDE